MCPLVDTGAVFIGANLFVYGPMSTGRCPTPPEASLPASKSLRLLCQEALEAASWAGPHCFTLSRSAFALTIYGKALVAQVIYALNIQFAEQELPE